jgi:hypothetical protein
MNDEDKAYERYKARMKEKGGKVATREQYSTIYARLQKKYPKMMARAIVGKRSKSNNDYAKTYPLIKYAKETGSPSLEGAKGTDKKEIEKLLKGKK